MAQSNGGWGLSLAFLPPKTAAAFAQFQSARKALYALDPLYCSITCSGPGASQEGAFQVVGDLLDEGQKVACHLSCTGASKQQVLLALAQLKVMGVRRLVAVRGDGASDPAPEGGAFGDAGDLVAFIRAHTGHDFHIDVAAYPDVHPLSHSAKTDVQAFVAKIKAGADSAITQYFYSADAYWRLVDAVRAQGVDVPIVPGIMPMTNALNLLRFSDRCGAQVPGWIRQRLVSFGQDWASVQAFGLDVVSRLCAQLIEQGAPGLHVFTMNQSAPTLALAQRLGRHD